VTIRTPIIAGNWKLHHGPSETAAFFAGFLPRLDADLNATVAFFPPSLSLAAARAALAARTDILLGVQNLYWAPRGAFTGEISAPLAADAGATLALVGHSERRHLFGETDADTARKTRAALDGGLRAVLCLGETLAEREADRAFAVVERQLAAVADVLLEEDVPSLAIAYEPVWAIGTGRTALPADASVMHGHLRALLDQRFGLPGREIPLLYGGSVKPDNAGDLLAAPDGEGLLVGGASLEPASFAAICAHAA
jgi:triosephosphate isomerase (TIM)